MNNKRIENTTTRIKGKVLVTLGALIGAFTLSTPAFAQTPPPRLIVSPSADVAATANYPAISDSALVAVGGGSAVAPHFVDGHWLANGGFLPRDVDAFTWMPGIAPGRNISLVFSFMSDEYGFLDGDILSLNHQGGVKLIYSEQNIANAVGVPDANLDLDALSFDDLGQVVFSLAADLDGTVLGAVKDGDVLTLLASGSITRLVDEAGVQAAFTAATGLTGAIGDVQGVEIVAGEVWVTTQGPTSHDGAIFSCGPVPTVIADEAAIGLEGAELDALAVVRPGDEIPSLHIDKLESQAGDSLHATVRGAPGSQHVVFISGGAGFIEADWLPGWGACYLDPLDPWLQVFLAAPMLNWVACDANGVFEIDYLLPVDPWWGIGFGGEEGWTFQMLDLASAQISAPIRVEKL